MTHKVLHDMNSIKLHPTPLPLLHFATTTFVSWSSLKQLSRLPLGIFVLDVFSFWKYGSLSHFLLTCQFIWNIHEITTLLMTPYSLTTLYLFLLWYFHHLIYQSALVYFPPLKHKFCFILWYIPST